MKGLIMKGIVVFCAALTSFITGYGIGAAFDAIDVALNEDKKEAENR